MSERDGQSSSSSGWMLGALVIAVAVGALLWFRMAPVPIGPGPIAPPGTVAGNADPLRAIELKNSAIALMENGKYADAVEKFAELEQHASGDLLVRQNQAVAAVLAISSEALDKVWDAEKYQTGLARATKLVADFQSSREPSAVGHLLAARLAEHRDDRRKSFEELEAAAKVANSDPVMEAEVYLASRLSDDKELQDRGLAALKRAAATMDDNLWLLTELLVAQARNKDAEVAKTFGQLKQHSQPFVEMIKTLRKVDLGEMLTKGEEGVGKEGV